MMRILKTFPRSLKMGIFAGILSGAFLVLAGCSGNDETQESEEPKAEASAEKQLWTCGMHPEVILEEPGDCPICGMNLVPLKREAKAAEPMAGMETGEAGGQTMDAADKGEKKILYWRAPMDPTYIRDKPGKSPMGMDLIPVYEGEADLGGGQTVVIDPVTVQNIGVQTATVKEASLSRIIRTVGHVDYNEQTLYRVNIKFSGWVERLRVNETGQPVRKGQPLLEIYSPELVTTQQEYLLALENSRKVKQSSFQDVAKSGQSLLESTKKRLLYWDLTEKQIQALEERGEVTKTVTLYSPSSGIVITKMAEEGMRVMPGMDLYRIADLSTIWVYANIYDHEVAWVRQGQEAMMELPYIPGRTFRGTVDYVYPYLNEKTRDVKVRLVFKNPNLELKPQMYANVRLESSIGADVVAIPNEAIIRSGTRNLVFVSKGGGKFEPRNVVLGMEGEGGMVQILAGVNDGEKIVTSAQFLFDSESRLKEAIQKMLESRMASKSAPKKEEEMKDMKDQETQHNH